MSFEARRWVLYKTVEKMVHIYKVIAENREVDLRLSGASTSLALMDHRTIHIIPSVFIDNALKYCHRGEIVYVRVCDEFRGTVPVISVEVKSHGPIATKEEEENLFVRRGRGQAARGVSEGSGIG